MATIKAYTDLEQSKKLAEILPPDSADMAWCNNSMKVTGQYSANLYTVKEMQECFDEILNGWDKYWELIPCWSLAALLELIPTDDKKDEYYIDTESHSDYHIVNYRNCWDGCIHSEYSEESLLDAAVEIICWLKENNKL